MSDGRREDGQAIVLFLLMIGVLLGASAMIIDVGYWYVEKGRARSAADAAALAAAASLYDAALSPTAFAHSPYRANFQEGGITLRVSSTIVAGDTVTATAQTTAPSYFAREFGIDSANIGARATARIGSYSGWSESLAPWAVRQADLQYGHSVALKVSPGNQVASGNFGAINLIVPGGQICSPAHGANDYRDLIENVIHSCEIDIGDQLDLKTGNMSILDGQNGALTQRGTINNFDPQTLMTTGADGSVALRTYSHPNLVAIPVIDDWVGGSHPVTVVSFAWFIITDFTSDTVNGVFVRSSVAPGMQCRTSSTATVDCPVGGYDPNGMTTIVLVD